jgi:hypothetical protein
MVRRTMAAHRVLSGKPIACICLLVCAPLLGCRSIQPPTQPAAPAASQPDTLTNAPAKVVAHFPNRPYDFTTCQKLNPVWWFGNADDPEPPKSYRSNECCRKFTWYLRNPCHNFTFFVMGIADKPFTRTGRFPGEIANPNEGWNWAVCRYKRIRLPFIAYNHGRFQFYCGWRKGGNFGVKCNFGGKKKDPNPEKAAT